MDVLNGGYSTSGVFKIHPQQYPSGLEVYCDMTSDNGSWIVSFILRQQPYFAFIVLDAWNGKTCGFNVHIIFLITKNNAITVTVNIMKHQLVYQFNNYIILIRYDIVYDIIAGVSEALRWVC